MNRTGGSGIPDWINIMGYSNPLLKLPAGKALMALPAEDRQRIEAVMRDLRDQANIEAEISWRRRKGPMATYHRAVSTYARHFAHALSRSTSRPRREVSERTKKKTAPENVMQFSTDQKHAATLEFLTEVRDYLQRLPAHPMHHAMLMRMNDHLAEPTHKLVRSHNFTRSGSAYTAVGMHLASLKVERDAATVVMATGKAAAPEQTIVAAFKKGLAFELHIDESF